MARCCQPPLQHSLRYKEQRTQKPSDSSVRLAQAASGCRRRGGLELLGASPGVPGANGGSPGCAEWWGPPARHPGGLDAGAPDGGSESSLFQLVPRSPVAAPAPGRAVAQPPAWPEVAEAGKTRGVGCRQGGGEVTDAGLLARSVMFGGIPARPRERKLTTSPHGAVGAAVSERQRRKTDRATVVAWVTGTH